MNFHKASHKGVDQGSLKLMHVWKWGMKTWMAALAGRGSVGTPMGKGLVSV